MAADYSFLKGVGQEIDMTKDSRFTQQTDPNSVSGGTVGGNGWGMFNFDQFAGPGQSFNYGNVNDPSGGGFNAGIKVDEAKKWMDSMGYKLNEYVGDDDTGYIYLTDKAGNVVGEPTTTDQGLDKAFVGAFLAAAAVATGGIASAGFGVGGAPGAAAAGGGATGAVSAGTAAELGALDAGMMGSGVTAAEGAAGVTAGEVAMGGGDALAAEIAGGAGADVAGVAAEGAVSTTTVPGYSAAANYGAGMTGAQTGMFDGVLAATGSTTAASAASTATGWAGSAWEWLGGGSTVTSGGMSFGNSLVRDLLRLTGAGVLQASAENATDEQRAWIEKQEADKRRRQMTAKTPGMFFTTSKGRNG